MRLPWQICEPFSGRTEGTVSIEIVHFLLFLRKNEKNEKKVW